MALSATTPQLMLKASTRQVPVGLQRRWFSPVVVRPRMDPTGPVGRRLVSAHVIIRQRVQRVDPDIQEVLFTQEQLNEVLDDLGRQIGKDYDGKDLLVLGVLKGGFVFTADLVRHISPVPASMEVEFFRAASYGLGMHSPGSIKLDEHFDLTQVKDKHVLVSEDIIDTGLTMHAIVSTLRAAGAMSVRVVVLLDKRARRKITFDPDYVGIVCPDSFVVGYGIDFAEKYRWLPYIGVPKPEVVEAIKAETERKQQAEAQKREKQLAAKQVPASGGHAKNSSMTKGTDGLSLVGLQNGHNLNGNGHNGRGGSNGHAVKLLTKP